MAFVLHRPSAHSAQLLMCKDTIKLCCVLRKLHSLRHDKRKIKELKILLQNTVPLNDFQRTQCNPFICVSLSIPNTSTSILYCYNMNHGNRPRLRSHHRYGISESLNGWRLALSREQSARSGALDASTPEVYQAGVKSPSHIAAWFIFPQQQVLSCDLCMKPLFVGY